MPRYSYKGPEGIAERIAELEQRMKRLEARVTGLTKKNVTATATTKGETDGTAESTTS